MASKGEIQAARERSMAHQLALSEVDRAVRQALAVGLPADVVARAFALALREDGRPAAAAAVVKAGRVGLKNH